MTAPRRNRTARGRTRRVLALALMIALGASAGHAMTERIVIDWRTGLAIHGYDPVAYFTDARPMSGRAELEFPFAGAVWRFRNPGNRAAFADRPDVYMPKFGGYDPVAVARGVATPGHPQLFMIVGERLYLFHTAETRTAFAADPAPAIKAAEAKWPALMRTLVP